jgi:hypothetical protein
MADPEQIDKRYANLWRNAQQSLKKYAEHHIQQKGNIYTQSFERTLSQPKSSSKKEMTLEKDHGVIDETCMEYFIKVVSSSEKAEQMKYRRKSYPDISDETQYHNNPMMT